MADIPVPIPQKTGRRAERECSCSQRDPVPIRALTPPEVVEGPSVVDEILRPPGTTFPAKGLFGWMLEKK